MGENTDKGFLAGGRPENMGRIHNTDADRRGDSMGFWLSDQAAECAVVFSRSDGGVSCGNR